MTAYRIARVGRVPPPKVYRVLQQLKDSGLATQVSIGPGRSAWELSDPYLRAFLVRQIRIVDVDDLAQGPRARSRVEADWIARIRPIRLRRYRPEPGRVTSPQEYLRPPEKDAALKARGLPTSRRRRRRP